MPDRSVSGPASVADVRARRAEPVTIELPVSGVTVRVKEIDVMDLVAAGDIPDTLSHHVWESFDGKVRGKTPKQTQELLVERRRIVHIVCCAMLVEPRMTMDDPPAPDTISPSDLPWPDREMLWAVACGNGRLADLRRFRGEPASPVAAAPDGAGVLHPAVDAVGPEA